MQFTKFIALTEAVKDKKLAVFTYGRFQCPTKGHAKLISTIVSEATKRGGDYFIFPSRSYDKKKNPLDPVTKISFLKELFPGVKFINDETVKNPFSALRFLLERGYTDLVMVIGSDRMLGMESLKKSALNTFDTVELMSAGERDPDSDDMIGAMSGTKARLAASKDDLGGFRSATGWSGDVSIKLMDAVKNGMNDE